MAGGIAARHPLAREDVQTENADHLGRAQQYEEAGNWFLAGETYSAMAEASPHGKEAGRTRAKLLLRSATAFEVAGQHVSASRTYSAAARLLSDDGDIQVAAEVFCRAARSHVRGGEYFSSGTSWMAAAQEFEKLGVAHVHSVENVHPLPSTAAGLTFAGRCLEEAGEMFLLCPGTQANWACMAYWLAGDKYAATYPKPNIQTFNAYKDALAVGIRQYGTLRADRTRVYLPFKEEEREAGVDALEILEESLFQSNASHAVMNPHLESSKHARAQTDEEFAATLVEFALSAVSLGHSGEASRLRRLANRRRERSLLIRRRLPQWVLYRLWRLTSGYGEDLGRWALFTCAAIITFAGLFWAGNAAAPASGPGDFLYFSVITFTSLGYGDVHPVGALGKVLACAEIATGLVAFGVLLSFVSNRLGNR